MAISRALMNRQLYNMGGPSQPRQMYDMGGSSLQAGAPDLRLTGDVRPTYTQGRKNRMDMAFGGIAGLDGRKRYGIGSWFQEKIMDPIKDNPVTSAVIGGGLLNQFGLPGGGYGKNFLGDLLSKVTGTTQGIDTVIGGGENNQFNLGDYLKKAVGIEQNTSGSTSNEIDDFIGDQTGYGQANTGGMDDAGLPENWKEILGGQMSNEGGITNTVKDYLGNLGIPGFTSGTNNPNLQSPAAQDQLAIEKYRRGNLNRDLAKAIAGGTAAGAFVNSQPKDTLAADNTGINFQTAQEVMDDPNQRFKPPVEATQLAANGGRIGYQNGMNVDPMTPDIDPNDIDALVESYMKSPEGEQELTNQTNQGMSMSKIVGEMKQELMMAQASSQGNMQMQQPQMAAMGGRIGYSTGANYNKKQVEMMIKKGADNDLIKTYSDGILDDDINKIRKEVQGLMQGKAEGGLMDLGGNEMDLRAEGGFIPIGGKEKADDVPARLSKNEFVFTADAVRNAGGGDIDEGAQVMERLMKSLEQGGEVSEESQGLDGAREMFETSQRLEKRII